MQTSSVARASLSTSITRSRSAPYASVIGPFSISARARSRRTLTSVMKSLMKCPYPSTRGWSRHGQDIQNLVELGFGDLALSDIPTFEHNLLDRLAFFQCLLGDLRGLVVPDVVVERRDDGGRGLCIVAAALFVRLDPVDALVGQQPRDRAQESDRLQQVARDDRQHHVELEVAGAGAECDRTVVAHHLRDDLADRLGDDRVHLARHARRTRLEVGNLYLSQPCARTR